MNKTTRRKAIGAAAVAVVSAGVGQTLQASQTSGSASPQKKVHYRGEKPKETPLFSSAVSYGNLLFVAGKGAHFEGDVRAHTKHVLDEIEKELINAGSSMEKVLKANVYLRRMEDYAAMNEVYRGRFGNEPPVRTTVACADGIPGGSMVEIDVIAYI
jgi:enamine deaminase RidA (YjgF/YER057c/UK114 family)